MPLVKKKLANERQTPLVPAGALSLKNFSDRCTACQLCVSVCPNNVLRPSTSLMNMMQPEMGYEKGYCRPECTKCSEVCPAGAIRPISVEEKSSIQIGHAVVNLDLCVVNTDDVDCGNCARHCPADAITMVKKNPEDMLSIRIPSVNEQMCIGCGACENLCPARPVAAIHVEGHLVHKDI
jgi:ferredoxin